MSKLTLAAVMAVLILASGAHAAPIAGQFVPVGIYLDTNGAFGMTYDPVNDVIHYSQGDSGDSIIHTLKPFKNYTPAEIAALPTIGGIPVLSLAAGMHDVAGTTSPVGGSYFRSLAFDSLIGQIVMQSGFGLLQSFDPFTAGSPNPDYAPGSANNSFSDGLDVDTAGVWYSEDVQEIRLNGVQLIPANVLLPSWTGLGDATSNGFSGVEQVGSSLFAVAVHSNADAGRSRTIYRFDLAGNLLGYDPDGDPIAARWEDLAYDGTFLYAADLRGNANGAGARGDIYVFRVTGGLDPDNPIPEPGTIALMGLGLLGIGLAHRARSRRK